MIKITNPMTHQHEVEAAKSIKTLQLAHGSNLLTIRTHNLEGQLQPFYFLARLDYSIVTRTGLTTNYK